jgi:hypothetical protein
MERDTKKLFLENGGVLLQPEDQLSEDELSKEYAFEPAEKEKIQHG